MIALRNRVRFADEDGLSLIEIVVAMMIFTIITTGLLYTMASLLTVTRDSRSRQVAANLAAQEVDLARDADDIFIFGTKTTEYTLNGDTFTVVRKSAWVASTAGAEACGAGGGTLSFKKINILVTWEGMREGTTGVTTDTLINPNVRINDPEKGTILVAVTDANSDGLANVPVTAQLTSGGSTLSATTDSDGCAYLLQVPEGNYNVKISSPGGAFVDASGATNPSFTRPVVKGTSTSVQFTYDQSGKLEIAYAGAGRLPLSMESTLLSARNPVFSTASTTANPRTLDVFPWPDGNSVVAGNAIACAATDPDNWAASGAKADGARPAAVYAAANTTAQIQVPMGVVRVKGLSGTSYVVAVSSDVATGGQPGCATVQTLRYAPTNSGNVDINLPFGTWTIYRGTTTNYAPAASLRVSGANIEVVQLSSVNTTTNLVTVDPRPDL